MVEQTLFEKILEFLFWPKYNCKEWKLYDKRCFKNNKPPKTIKKD